MSAIHVVTVLACSLVLTGCPWSDGYYVEGEPDAEGADASATTVGSSGISGVGASGGASAGTGGAEVGGSLGSGASGGTGGSNDSGGAGGSGGTPGSGGGGTGGGGTGGSGGATDTGGGNEVDCSGITRAGHELCSSTADSCRAVFTDGAGCTQVCAEADLPCVTAAENMEGYCAPRTDLPDVPCDSGHESDFCVCGYATTNGR